MYCTVAGVVPEFTSTSVKAPHAPPQVVLPVTVPLVTDEVQVNTPPAIPEVNVGLYVPPLQTTVEPVIVAVGSTLTESATVTGVPTQEPVLEVGVIVYVT